jgi:hypothetical protein
MEQSEQRRPQHVARTPQGEQPKQEETKTYRVKDGQTWGTNPELQAGDTVELTEKEAASFLDKLEPHPEGSRAPKTDDTSTTPPAPGSLPGPGGSPPPTPPAVSRSRS